MPTLKQLVAQRDKVDERYRAASRNAEAAIVRKIRGSKITCMKCGVMSAVRLWALQLQIYWNHNTGSPSGGFWDHGGPDTDSVICPKCDHVNYIYTHTERDRIALLRQVSRDGVIWAQITEKRNE